MKGNHALRPVQDDEALDSVEVPAAVVCARCGSPDCLGCEPVEETTHPSGVVAIVPWERPGLSGWTRLWSTSRLVTRSAPQFFAAIPPGGYAGAVRFAIISELAAVSSTALSMMLLFTVLAPSLAWEIISDPAGQMVVLRVLLFGVVGFSSVLLGGHVLHGLMLDRGACRQGARTHRSQAVRFGLYSTGWDLLSSSPLGVVFTLLSEGPRAAAALLPLSMVVPGTAGRAFVRGIYHLDERRGARAVRFGVTVAMAVAVIAAMFMMVLLGVLVII